MGTYSVARLAEAAGQDRVESSAAWGRLSTAYPSSLERQVLKCVFEAGQAVRPTRRFVYRAQ
jgi:hypothetical protein